MTSDKAHNIPVTALSGELLDRSYKYLDDPGAFGRLTQEILVAALKMIHPDAHDNRGAGTPDCKYLTQSTAWAWEIKHDPDGEIKLSDRDIEGLMADNRVPDHRPRLVILDMRFPVSIWCLDASNIQEGNFLTDSHAHLQQTVEAEQLVTHTNTILKLCDIEIIATEEIAKTLVQEVATKLNAKDQ